MKRLVLLPLLALAAPAPAQQQQPKDDAIVVTGAPLSTTARNLRECIARHCPTDQDVAATLAHAENLFVAGDYQEARRITQESLGRNRGNSSAFPVPVSNLYRADARLAMHLGAAEAFENSTYGIKRALKAGLPDKDPRVVGADLEIAAMKASLGRFDSARETYSDAARNAQAIGRPDLAAMARVKQALLYRSQGFTTEARRILSEVAADQSPAARAPRLAALVALARIDRQTGKGGDPDALIAQLKSAGLSQPVLLSAPDVDMTPTAIATAVGSVSTPNIQKMWVDVGFWVTPDGRVSDAEILRSSGPTAWFDPMMRSIQGRLYSPSEDQNGGAYRVERYSYTAMWQDATGTRLKARSPYARIEYLDLTAEPQTKQN